MTDRDPPGDTGAREADAGEEVRVASEPPREPEPAEVRPGVSNRVAWAVAAGGLAAALLWLIGRLIDAPEQMLDLTPGTSAGVIAAVLAGAVRDPVGRLALAGLVALGGLITFLMLDAPIFGVFMAVLILLPAVNRITGFGGTVSRSLRPVRRASSRRFASRSAGGLSLGGGSSSRCSAC